MAKFTWKRILAVGVLAGSLTAALGLTLKQQTIADYAQPKTVITLVGINVRPYAGAARNVGSVSDPQVRGGIDEAVRSSEERQNWYNDEIIKVAGRTPRDGAPSTNYPGGEKLWWFDVTGTEADRLISRLQSISPPSGNSIAILVRNADGTGTYYLDGVWKPERR